jgi:hypothetical protein
VAVTISVPKRWGCGSPVDFFEIIAPDEVLILRFKYPCAGCKYIIIRYLRNVDDDDEHESSAEIATHGTGVFELHRDLAAVYNRGPFSINLLLKYKRGSRERRYSEREILRSSLLLLR